MDKRKTKSYYKVETWDDLIKGRRIFTDPSVLIAREKVLAVHGYRTFQRSGMDVDLWLRVMEKFGPCVTITEPLFGKRLEPGSLIFNPATSLINQVPRALALQRKQRGSDDIDDRRLVDIGSFLKRGLIKAGSENESMALFVGSAVTCLWLFDFHGVKVYLSHALNLAPSLRGKALVLFRVFEKALMRLRYNPYKKFSFNS